MQLQILQLPSNTTNWGHATDFDRVDEKHQKSKFPRECTQQSKAPNESVSDRRTKPPDNGNFSNFWERPGDRFEACGRRRVSRAKVLLIMSRMMYLITSGHIIKFNTLAATTTKN